MAKQIQLDLVFFFWGPSQYTLKNRKKDPSMKPNTSNL